MKKKILIFSIAYYPFVGGAEVAVKEITDRLGYEWHMVTCALDDTLPQEETIGKVFVHRVSSRKFLFPFVAFWHARKLHKAHDFDAVWSIMAAYGGFAALFFKLTHKKVKFLLTLQEGDPISYIKRKVWFVYPLFGMIFRRADAIQAISEFLAAFGRSMGFKKPIEVISNGVDLDRFSYIYPESEKENIRKELQKKEGDIFLVTTSRLVKKNAVDDIITALTFLPKHFSLVVIGKGEEGPLLGEQAKRLGLSHRVKFLGFVPHLDIPRYFSVCDIFVRPSRSEGFGNSFIEAMAARLPVVATPVGGIPDFIDDRETGIFCAPDNPKSIALAVTALSEDKALTHKIIQNAFKRVHERYGWDHVAHAMEEKVFNELFV